MVFLGNTLHSQDLCYYAFSRQCFSFKDEISVFMNLNCLVNNAQLIILFQPLQFLLYL